MHCTVNCKVQYPNIAQLSDSITIRKCSKTKKNLSNHQRMLLKNIMSQKSLTIKIETNKKRIIQLSSDFKSLKVPLIAKAAALNKLIGQLQLKSFYL
ncbi:hypothetical protein T08_12191 [Trichinella sp. T8]|nr:hypothetical protein T08_12191 [Trichinella sp. T8]